MTIEIEGDAVPIVDPGAREANPWEDEAGDIPEQSPIELVELAIHALDHRGNGLLLSKATVELDEPVTELFTGYILKAMTSSRTRMARFMGDSPTRSAIFNILKGSVDLLDGSQALARRLFGAMEKKNPGDGDLAVIMAVEKASGSSMLAVLKLDLSSGFKHEVTEVDGVERLRLTPVQDLLPDASRRLQKAAFIPALPHNLPYDLLVVDKQASSDDRGVASFFLGSFLECELVDGPRELTKKVAIEAEKWIQQEAVPPVMGIEAREAIIEGLRDPEVNVSRMAQDAFPDEERRSRFISHMEDAGFDGVHFTADQAMVERMSAVLTYLLDGGVKINGDALVMADLLQVEPDPTQDGKVRIVIETARFERKY
jgi:hypothetical protein